MRKPLEDPEMVEILENIARNGGDTARIQAIKTLRALDGGEEQPPADDWGAIYGSDSNVTPIKRAG